MRHCDWSSTQGLLRHKTGIKIRTYTVIFQRLTKYGTQANSHDWLKTIAILLMVVDHVGVYLFPSEYLFRFVGRFSFPIFFFLIGYTYQGLREDSPASSSAWKKYYIKQPPLLKKVLDFFWALSIKSDLLLCLLLITVSNYLLVQNVFPLNILFTVIVCRIVIYLLDKFQLLDNWLIMSWLFFTLLHVPLIFVYEYGGVAILITILGQLVRKNRQGEIKVRVFIFLSYLSYCASQMVYFPATFNYIASLYIGIAVLFVLLSTYQFQKKFLLPNLSAVNLPVMFISRYSLYVYTAHLLILKITAKYFV